MERERNGWKTMTVRLILFASNIFSFFLLLFFHMAQMCTHFSFYFSNAINMYKQFLAKRLIMCKRSFLVHIRLLWMMVTIYKWNVCVCMCICVDRVKWAIPIWNDNNIGHCYIAIPRQSHIAYECVRAFAFSIKYYN